MVGLVAIPLSLVPFVVYATVTAEGRLLADKVSVAIDPPTLPSLTHAEIAALRAAAPEYRRAAAVLVYHGLGSSAEGDGEISGDDFAEHLAALRAAGFQTVTISDLAAAARGARSLPPRAVAITFDDGRTDSILWADPLLEQAHMVATMFVITDRAESGGIHYADWARLEDMASSSRWDLQSHTANHHHHENIDGREIPALTFRDPTETLADARQSIEDDLDASNRAILDHTGVAPAGFAYPFGAWGGDDRTNDPGMAAVIVAAVSERFVLGFQQDDQEDVPLAGCGGDPTLVRRLDVGQWSGLELVDRISQMVADTTAPCHW